MNKFNKSTVILILLCLSSAIAAQSRPKLIASTKLRKYTLEDAKPETRDGFLQLDTEVAKERKDLLQRQIGGIILRAEAASRGVSVDELIKTEVTSRVTEPTDAEIRAYFDSHPTDFENQPFDQEKSDIAKFLRRQAQRQQRDSFIASLKTKFPVAYGKDVNAADLKADDVLASVGDQKVTLQTFEEKNRAAVWGVRADAYETLISEIEDAMFHDLLSVEAKKKGVASADELLQKSTAGLSEIDKYLAEAKLRESLFKKYHAKTLLDRPQYTDKIAIKDAPFRGNPKAPVTVVMFSDFQCPHCAKAHLFIDKVLADFGNEVRFAVINYPLSSIHANAFRAAEAAAAAQSQGKFFEYAELLYQNQEALDETSLRKYASSLSLDMKRFDEDMSAGKFAAKIKADVAEGDRLGLFGTPTVFVNGSEVYALTPANLRGQIQRALKALARIRRRVSTSHSPRAIKKRPRRMSGTALLVIEPI